MTARATDAIEPVHVAVTCDENYAMPLAAMLVSLAASLDPQRRLVIHALGHGLQAPVWDRLAKSLPEGRARWNRIDVDTTGLRTEGFGTRAYDHISPVCYFRLLLPELLPDDVEKVLYLDCDLVIREDLSSLWETDISVTAFAAAHELQSPAVKARLVDGIRFHRELGLTRDRARFNSGVLLMNLAHWRRSQLALRAFTYLRVLGDDVLWYEQEALNVIARDEYRELDRRWNVPSQWAAQWPHGRVSIVHFLTASKPWHWDYAWAAKDSFFAALDQTPWAGWRPTRPTWGHTRRLMGSLSKALRKRAYAARRVTEGLQRNLGYRLVRPKALTSGTPVPARFGTSPEIRLFIAVDHVDDRLCRTLEAHFFAGVDRAFVLVTAGNAAVPVLPPLLQSRVHVFNGSAAPGGHALRRLLDRFGETHWCVLGDQQLEAVDLDGRPVNFRNLCAHLDASGFEIVEAVTGSGAWLEMTARDLRSGRVFQGTAMVDAVPHAYNKPSFLSRVFLLKYRKTLLLDASAVLSGNARNSERRLRLTPPGDSGGP
jgi:lipopolysaccharide biosynthesis glycosyltransferase